jgi:acyl transferase domain-containing protein
MAGRFPGADDVRSFWRNLCEGVESVSSFTDEQLRTAGISEEVFRDPAYVRARAVLDKPEWFDAGFFGFTPREAELTDPQHRVFLECCVDRARGRRTRSRALWRQRRRVRRLEHEHVSAR